MYKIILYCSLLCLVSVYCDLNKEEGAACEWEGVKGTCVNSHRCFTALDDKSPKQPVCSTKGEDIIICCTDCELVNDTRNAVISPVADVFWKNGEKARDQCLEYVTKLPYACRSTFYSGISRKFDEAKKCHVYGGWIVGGAPPHGWKPANTYPHSALLGYGNDLELAQWLCSGSIISDSFILTAAHCESSPEYGPVKYVAYGPIDRSKPVSDWKYVEVKRIITHPEHKRPSKYNDIALIETATSITFEEDVLPACLHVMNSADDTATTTTWRDINEESWVFSNTLQEIPTKKYSNEECSQEYPASRLLRKGIDEITQMCYGDTETIAKVCKGIGGAPLLINTQISWCVDTIIGVTSFGKGCRGSRGYDVFTRVLHYVPWIESVVWP